MIPRVAVVGAGPAGLYLVGALVRARDPVQLDVFERLSVPFGLLRHGVAADHQGTKAVARQLARPFERGQARFFGRMELGRDISLDDLRTRYHVVVLATGAARDRKLDIPGGDLVPMFSANEILRRLNDDPAARGLPDLGTTPVIVGAGNVALDLVRLLLKDADGLVGSDLGPEATDWLLTPLQGQITLVARCAPDAARFDVSMVRELSTLRGGGISVDPMPTGDDPKSKALREIMHDGAVRLCLKFNRRPLSIKQSDKGQAILEVDTPRGRESLFASSIIAAIGTETDAHISLPNVYRLGWCSGATGALPAARRAALTLCQTILETLADRPPPKREALPDALWDWASWRAVDEEEQAYASADRVRRKITSWTAQDRITAQAMQ
ncbi:FAD-dependent oxidoreductase [Thalassococcus sp. S3]|uniref:FAD-dependent oxidoreductase n=1 Tax=Thalassococcus sp. S3 TaxID=2017482 RepID=UPI00102444FD|nr:FAD-dependent oxidoreductase [Thalassococcus sp. S3]QBF33433.1 hypothetical protein CFI11_19785 [Thalassococcus sp. S3]